MTSLSQEFSLRADQVSTTRIDRESVATDQWPMALLKNRHRQQPELGHSVMWPETAEEVAHIVHTARQLGLQIVPYGVGSGVVGGGWSQAGAITVDTKRLRRVRSLDREQGVADVEVGILGSHLEQYLRQQGLTLGHFPSSIICSSLGGWLAGRSAGQLSCRYGKIEDMVLSARLVDGQGQLATYTDPDLDSLIGSEGMLGIFTDARLMVWPKPEAEFYWGFEVRGVEHGLDVMRRLLQQGFTPSVLRLYDEFDSLVAKDKSIENHPKVRSLGGDVLNALKRRSLAMALAQPTALSFFSRQLPPRCLMIVGCEGRTAPAERMIEAIRQECHDAGATDLGDGPGRAWYAGRYHVSYRQSPIFLLGAYVDTMEISAPWSVVEQVYDGVRRALSSRAFVMAHFSHAYLDGCAVYFTFAARHPEDEVEHYRETLEQALRAATHHGGAVSHHHGVGLAKRDFLAQHHGPLWSKFAGLKQRFDPDQLFSRGKWT